MRKWISIFLFTLLLLGGCINKIAFDNNDTAALQKLFEAKGFTGVEINKDDSSFYRQSGKLKAKVLVHFDYKPLYEGNENDNPKQK